MLEIKIHLKYTTYQPLNIYITETVCQASLSQVPQHALGFSVNQHSHIKVLLFVTQKKVIFFTSEAPYFPHIPCLDSGQADEKESDGAVANDRRNNLENSR
jgi:hypothetical protein